MARKEKSVFISYRRDDAPWAIAIFQNLNRYGYDVFLDYDGLASGDFEGVIIGTIKARAHFLVLLTPSALARCGNSEDWLRREIETAIDHQRNIVPVMLAGFQFDNPNVTEQLTGKLGALKHYNALSVPPGYFDASMERLRKKYLNVQLDTVLHPASQFARHVAQKQQAEAATAPIIHPVGSMAEGQLVESSRSKSSKTNISLLSAASILGAAAITVALIISSSPQHPIASSGQEAKSDITRKQQPSASTPSQTTRPTVSPLNTKTKPSGSSAKKFRGGQGDLPKDNTQAVSEYRSKAAEASDTRSMMTPLPGLINFGLAYQSGQESSPDNTQIVNGYRKAAEAGDTQGMINLGMAYQYGQHGLTKDYTLAVNWYSKAAEAGDGQAMNYIGIAYENGKGGLPEDQPEAAKWYRAAAEAGDPSGMNNLGSMYENGRGAVPKDQAEAATWYRKAAALGNEQAKLNLKRLGLQP